MNDRSGDRARKTKQMPKRAMIALNIVGLLLLVFAGVLLPKAAKEWVVYQLGSRFWVYATVCVMLTTLILYRTYDWAEGKWGKAQAGFLIVVLFLALLLGSIFGWGEFSEKAATLGSRQNGVSMEQVAAELTQRYENDGGEVEYSQKQMKLVVVAQYAPDRYFGSETDSPYKRMIEFCERESLAGYQLFADNGYDVDVYYQICGTEGNVLFIAKNGKEDTADVGKLGCVSKIHKADFRRLTLHISVKKPRRSTTAPAFFASICKPIQQNCIF